MKRTLTFTAAVVVTVLSLAALPAAAQHHGSGGQARGGGHATAGSSAPRGMSAPARQSAPRASAGRSYSAPQTMSRSYGNRAYAAPQAVGRPFGWVPYHSFRFGRPYYLFSPSLALGFGLWAGYPVPYPWVDLGNYQPSVFGDYPDGNYEVTPGAINYGGVSFDIQPSDADLFVDGEYVGQVANFGPNTEPLTLAPGPHRIAIQHQGFRPMEWDVTVEPGQVIPYRGALERQ